MIDTDHIKFNDDGTAWLVVKAFEALRPNKWSSATYWSDADRPCDNCAGQGCAPPRGSDAAKVGDCNGVGRHTFTIDVDGYWRTLQDRQWPRTYRVSIVPDMVLKIELWDFNAPDEWAQRLGPCILFDEDANGPEDHIIALFDGEKITDFIGFAAKIPPAAKPGMYAVLLKINSK